jgi:hypothetical protein
MDQPQVSVLASSLKPQPRYRLTPSEKAAPLILYNHSYGIVRYVFAVPFSFVLAAQHSRCSPALRQPVIPGQTMFRQDRRLVLVCDDQRVVQTPMIVGQIDNPILEGNPPSLVASVRSRLRLVSPHTAVDLRPDLGP